MARRFGATSVVQTQQLGTGDAARVALPALADFSGDVIVYYGDHPLLTQAPLENLLARRAAGAAISFMGFRPADAGSYGRLVLLANGEVDRIVEARDATVEEMRIDFVSAGGFVLDVQSLRTYLGELNNNNAQREFYLTGIIDAARRRGLRCVAIEAPIDDVLGINSRAELAAVEAVMQRRLRERAMENGATLIDLAIYSRLSDVAVCYRCHSEFRGAYPLTKVGFDLHTADVLEMEYERKIGRR